MGLCYCLDGFFAEGAGGGGWGVGFDFLFCLGKSVFMKQLNWVRHGEHTDEGCVDWLWFVVCVDAQRSDDGVL